MGRMVAAASGTAVVTRPAVFVGLATLDVVFRVAGLPDADAKVSADWHAVAAGGPAANAAVTCALLALAQPGDPAVLVTALGEGPTAGLIRAELQRWGVRVTDVAAGLDWEPPVSAVAVQAATGERAIISREDPGRSAPVPAELEQVIADAALVLVDGHLPDLALACAALARSHGVEVVADVGRPKPVFDSLLPMVDVAICSSGFRRPGCADQEATARDLRALGVREVAFSNGGAPLRWWGWPAASADSGGADAAGERRPAGGREGLIIPPRIDAVDTNGAGDALHGAFCYYRTRLPGFAAQLRAAVAVASLRCTRLGPRAWLADLAAVRPGELA